MKKPCNFVSLLVNEDMECCNTVMPCWHKCRCGAVKWDMVCCEKLCHVDRCRTVDVDRDCTEVMPCWQVWGRRSGLHNGNHTGPTVREGLPEASSSQSGSAASGTSPGRLPQGAAAGAHQQTGQDWDRQAGEGLCVCTGRQLAGGGLVSNKPGLRLTGWRKSLPVSVLALNGGGRKGVVPVSSRPGLRSTSWRSLCA